MKLEQAYHGRLIAMYGGVAGLEWLEWRLQPGGKSAVGGIYG